ncbi:MAG: hypothetical protein EOP05_03185 [Proteobacteria bacterium]|nr:MAG: hypothetical protein EOP05_03185 [Pseudomonadota bacterium]
MSSTFHKHLGLKIASLACAGLVATFAAGCSEQKFGLGSESQEFGQKVTYNTEVDVLWVIDTSSSMDQHQDLMASQMGAFVSGLNETRLDYHMAVTTMDMGSSAGAKGKFLAAPGTQAILTNKTSNIVSVLSQRVRAGAAGSSVERGLEAMKVSLSSPLAGVNGMNAGFLRPNALLVVIFLSNEDDQSSGTARDYATWLDSVRPPLPTGERSWLAHFMGVTSGDASCKTSQWDQAGFSKVGTKFIALAEESGGSVEPICDADFRRALLNVKARILEVMTEYKLDRVPNLTTLTIYVNGAVVPQNADNGWTYYAPNNSVRFHGTGVPKPDASIRIAYDPAGMKE